MLKVVDPSHLLNTQLAEHLKDRTGKFAHFFEGVRECPVTVDPPGPEVEKGRFRVRIIISVPNSQIAINRQTGFDLPMDFRELFDAADQRLEAYVRISRLQRIQVIEAKEICLRRFGIYRTDPTMTWGGKRQWFDAGRKKLQRVPVFNNGQNE